MFYVGDCSMSIADTSGALTGMPTLVDGVSSPVTKGKARYLDGRVVAGSEISDLGREELDRLVQRVFLSRNGDSPHSVVFSGVDDSNGSAMVCARAGEALAAKSCRPICIVDADLQRKDIYRIFQVDDSDADRAADGRTRRQCVPVRSNLWVANASVLGCREGAPPDDEVAAQGMRDIRAEFDYVLINTASAGSRCDAALFGRMADGLILVLEASSTRRRVAQTVADTIKAVDVRLLGAVLNNRTYPIPAALYHRL